MDFSPRMETPGKILEARFKSPEARRNKKEKMWISGDLRFVPRSPQSELGKKESKKIRSRSRHKLKKISMLAKRCVSSEKSDSSIQDSVKKNFTNFS